MSKPETVILAGTRLVEVVLRHGSCKPEEIVVLRGGSARGLSRLVELAESRDVSVRWVDAEAMRKLAPTGAPAEIAAAMGPREDLALDRAVPPAPAGALLLALAGVEDPHNLGMILRTARAAGAHAVILEERARNMPRDIVARSSAGASECLPLVFTSDLAQTLDELRALSVETVAAACENGENLFHAKLSARLAFVVGGVRRGLGRKVEDACARRVTIPMSGEVQSLSAAAAAAVLLFEMYEDKAKVKGLRPKEDRLTALTTCN